MQLENKTFYACETTFENEMTSPNGITLFPSITALRDAMECVESGECKVVRLNISQVTRKERS